VLDHAFNAVWSSHPVLPGCPLNFFDPLNDGRRLPVLNQKTLKGFTFKRVPVRHQGFSRSLIGLRQFCIKLPKLGTFFWRDRLDHEILRGPSDMKFV
jgi:hypothetical protein